MFIWLLRPSINSVRLINIIEGNPFTESPLIVKVHEIDKTPSLQLPVFNQTAGRRGPADLTQTVDPSPGSFQAPFWTGFPAAGGPVPV